MLKTLHPFGFLNSVASAAEAHGLGSSDGRGSGWRRDLARLDFKRLTVDSFFLSPAPRRILKTDTTTA